MSLLVHLHSEFDRLRFSCDEDEPVVWVKSRDGDSISLALNKRDREALRTALMLADAVDELAANEAINGICVAAEDLPLRTGGFQLGEDAE